MDLSSSPDAGPGDASAARIKAVADQLLRVRRPTVLADAEAWARGARIIELSVDAPAGWPDGVRIPIRVRAVGQGPAVLVVHGLQGQPADLAAIIDDLVATGHTAWVPDLPGHGASGGERLSIPLVARLLVAVDGLAGPFELAVAHSIGGACLVQALEEGLQAHRVVLLATPTHFGVFARIAGRKAGLDGAGETALLAELERLIGLHPDRIDMARQATARHEAALIIHSDDDPIVPFQGAQRVATLWPGAQWSLVHGLGHTRPLLDDPGVRARVSRFVAAPTPFHSTVRGTV